MSACNKQISLFGALTATLIVAGAAAGGQRPGPAVRYEAHPFFYVLDIQDILAGGPGGAALDGSGPGVQAAADHIIDQQCPDGGWGWPHDDCSTTYNNITGPICQGLLKAYTITGDSDTLDAAVAGGNFDLTFVYGNGEYRFGAAAPYFLYRLTQVSGVSAYSDHAENEFFDELTAQTYGPSDLDTAGWIAAVVTGRQGAWVNLIPWEFSDIAPTAAAIGNADSTDPPDGISQEQKFIDAILAGLNTLDNTDPANVYSDLIGIAGAVQGLAMTDTTTFTAINSPNHSGIDAISTLCDLADQLVSYQNADGSWNWHSDLSSLGGATEGDKDTQTTAYAVMALVEANADCPSPGYDTEIAKARAWLDTMQDTDGGFFSYPGGGHNTEVEGEALTAMAINNLSLNMATTCENSGTVTVTIDMDDMPVNIVGGQFFLEYDTMYLTLVSVDVGDPPFTSEVSECSPVESIPPGCTPTVGQIDFAVGVDPFDHPGTSSARTMAVITFSTASELCTPTANLVKFRDPQPDPPTRLTDAVGNSILPTWVNLGPITIDETDPVITCEDDIEVYADAGECHATVTITPATATDNCGGTPSIVGTRSDFPETLTDPYPVGDTTITWVATDDCDNTATCYQTVTVDGQSELLLTVDLSPTTASGINRCITFEVDCGGEFSEVLTFTAGTGSKTVLVPCGTYTCISARDKLHTLRSTVSMVDAGTQFTASFTGADDWLVGGNLNDDEYIDILDFGVFVGEYTTDYGSGNTTCATPFPHADITGTGVVGTGDYQFISLNFLDVADDNCDGCAMPLMAGHGPTGPITRISTQALKRRGLHKLIVADLNHDGWLDLRDMQAFAAGARPR
ncbi:MAG: HYR domain-containing protein [Planctomycetota bacterium]|jgi:hypothetical protein